MRYFLIFVAIVLMNGCSSLENVAPYEKEHLATQKMLTDPNPTQSAFEAHIFPIREGSFGATSGFAGGCGCK